MAAMDDDVSLDEKEKATVAEIRDRVEIKKKYRERPGGRNRPALPRQIRGRQRDCHDQDARLNADAVERRLADAGVDASLMLERGRKREREQRAEADEEKRQEGAGDANDEDAEMEDAKG